MLQLQLKDFASKGQDDVLVQVEFVALWLKSSPQLKTLHALLAGPSGPGWQTLVNESASSSCPSEWQLQVKI